MSARQRARVSNDFAPSPDAIPLGALLSTAEVAAMLHLTPDGVRAQARRRHLTHGIGRGNRHYWMPDQVERLRGAP